MKKEFDILLVEDNEGDARIIKELLREQSAIFFRITKVGSLSGAIESISKTKYDTILLDLGLPDSFGIDTYLNLQRNCQNLTTTIILTGLNDVEIGFIAVNNGAQDYIVKGSFDSEKLIKSIIYSYERSNLNIELKLQIEARRLAEDEIRINLQRLKIMVDILQYQSESVQEYLDYSLSKALELTNSKIGYIYYYSEDREEFTLNSWSQEVMKECSILEQQTVYQLNKTGLWGEAVRQRKPIIINDFQKSHPLKKGYPDGHVQLLKYMTIPVFYKNKIAGVVAVANKKADYTETDSLQLTLLMDVVWETAERKKAEEEILSLNEKLESRVIERTEQLELLNKELDSFSHSVSHDLRAPLRHINGFAGVLKNDFREQMPFEAQKCLDSILDSTRKMGVLIDDLLKLSRTSRTDLHKTDVNMMRVVEDALSVVNPTSKSRKIDIKVSTLPEVIGDFNLLRIVWINLLDNAIKYTRNRKKTLITIGFNEDSNEFVFFIRDNGVGFDMNYVDKLFGAFQRLHSENDFEGTGIGLTTVNRIIVRHGGKTWAEGKVNKGATFYFSIPKYMHLEKEVTK